MRLLFGQVPPHCFYEDWRSTDYYQLFNKNISYQCFAINSQYLNRTGSQRLAAYHVSPGFWHRQVSTCVRFPPQAASSTSICTLKYCLWMFFFLVIFSLLFTQTSPLCDMADGLMQVILFSTTDAGSGFMRKLVHQPRCWRNEGFAGLNWCHNNSDWNKLFARVQILYLNSHQIIHFPYVITYLFNNKVFNQFY